MDEVYMCVLLVKIGFVRANEVEVKRYSEVTACR